MVVAVELANFRSVLGQYEPASHGMGLAIARPQETLCVGLVQSEVHHAVGGGELCGWEARAASETPVKGLSQGGLGPGCRTLGLLGC